MILANRGTEFVWYNPWQTDPKDTFADGRILSGITPSEQFQSMVNFIKDKIGNSQFDVTGHSLGGCLSQTVKAAYGARVDEVYAYNALGAKNLAPDYFKI